MKVTYVNNPQSGPGHGYFMLFSLPVNTELAGASYALQRASDQQCLGEYGWQPADCQFPLPEGDDYTTIAVGPSVVDFLDTQENYRFTIRLANGTTLRSGLAIDDIHYSGSHSGSVPQPAPPPPPVVEEPIAEPPKELEVPTIALQEEQPSVSLPQEGTNKNKWLLLALVGVVLVALGAGAIFFFLGNSGEKQDTRPALQQAKQHLAGPGDVATSLALAKKFSESSQSAQPATQDAIFLLVEDAATKGSAEAAMLVASFFDPTQPAQGSVFKTPAEALRFYKQAAAKNIPEASSRMQQLRQWAEKEANAGSAEAKALLTEF